MSRFHVLHLTCVSVHLLLGLRSVHVLRLRSLNSHRHQLARTRLKFGARSFRTPTYTFLFQHAYLSRLQTQLLLSAV